MSIENFSEGYSLWLDCSFSQLMVVYVPSLWLLEGRVAHSVSYFQRIQTVSATDPDEPLGGHRFFFGLAQEAAGKANFSVRDNKGNTLSARARGHRINFNLLVYCSHKALTPVVLNHICTMMQFIVFHLAALKAHSQNQMKFQAEFIEIFIQPISIAAQ